MLMSYAVSNHVDFNHGKLQLLKAGIDRLNKKIENMLDLVDRFEIIHSNNFNSIIRIIENLKDRDNCEINLGNIKNLKYKIDFTNELCSCTITYDEYVLKEEFSFNEYNNIVIKRNTLAREYNKEAIKLDLLKSAGLQKLLSTRYEGYKL